MTNLVSLQPDWPAPKQVRLISTTRGGGCSLSPYDSLNLALHTNDDKTNVEENRRRLHKHLNLPSEPVWLNQVHGKHVASLDDNLMGSGSVINADASYSTQRGKVCAVLTADCLPVLITDINGSVVAAAHAGWKGLLAGVISSTVEVLAVKRRDILVWLGPAIGAEAFIVGSEVRTLFGEKAKDYLAAFQSEAEGRWFCDLYQLARIELAKLGVEQVYGGEFCTFTDKKRFYSYRRDGENTGRMAHCIWLNNQSV